MEIGYRLVSYAGAAGQPAAGVLIGGKVTPAEAVLSQPGDPTSVIAMLRSWDSVHARLQAATEGSGAPPGTPIDQVKLLAPILYPGALFCAGANYWDHLEEMAEIAKRTTGKAPSMTKGAEPWFFMKTTAGSMIGHGTPARLPSFSNGGEVIFSESVRDDPEVVQFLEKNVQPNMVTRFSGDIKGYDQAFPLWRMKI